MQQAGVSVVNFHPLDQGFSTCGTLNGGTRQATLVPDPCALLPQKRNKGCAKCKFLLKGYSVGKRLRTPALDLLFIESLSFTFINVL